MEQCARHITKLPAFEGIAIDRLDYSEYFNIDADDNTSWVPLAGSGRSWTSWAEVSRGLQLQPLWRTLLKL